MFRLVYFDVKLNEFYGSYDEVMKMISDLVHGKVLNVNKI